MWITRQSPCLIRITPRRLRKLDLRERVVTWAHQNGKVQLKNAALVIIQKRDFLL
jgi:hypothetical protein